MKQTLPRRLRRIADELQKIADELDNRTPAPPPLIETDRNSIALRGGLRLIVDPIHFADMNLSWSAFKPHRVIYAHRCFSVDGRPQWITAHRYVLKLAGISIPAGRQVRFRNGNGLDVRLSNLLVA